MSPVGRGGWYEPRSRIAVEGGVAVPKPGKVSDPDALAIIEAAAIETRPPILSRGRTYARAGQVIGVTADAEGFSGRIQGSERRPYEVRLNRHMISGADRIHADCSCPYTCDYDWCKHAAALAYVAAFLVDTQPATRAVWIGEEPAPEVEELSEADLALLRSTAQVRSFAQRVSDCEHLRPWPGPALPT
jgi:uncharacterized Zn finger protein